MGFNSDGGNIEDWEYNGTVYGDLYYAEGTSTKLGIPKK